MLDQCGYEVAVSNAVKEILDMADYTTGSNGEDGVAKFIEKNVLFSGKVDGDMPVVYKYR